MEKYTIYCTEEQTRRALELGAPIKIRPYVTQEKYKDYSYVCGGIDFVIPTAEQMIGWLEEQGLVVEIILSDEEEHPWIFTISKVEDVYAYDTRKEATLAAIDAALDYFKQNQEVIWK